MPIVRDVSQSDYRVYNLYVDDPYTKLSENFSLWEWACRDGSPAVRVNMATVNGLQYIRDQLGRLKINSAYRTVQHNASVGGAKNSRHLYGMAADVVPVMATLALLKVIADTMDWGGIGIYNTFVHLDPWRTNRRWNATNQNQPR